MLKPILIVLAAGIGIGRAASAASLPECPAAQEHSLPLPSTVPPDQFVPFERQVLEFLQSHTYEHLGWCVDKEIRNTGPYQKGVSYGTHPAVRVYYSPKVMEWLVNGRQGSIPDGGMIVKEQYPPPAERYGSSVPEVSDWTVMIRDSSRSKDGWFWGEWYDGMAFDDDKFPFTYPNAGFGIYCLRCHSSAEKQYTFSAIANIKGFPGKPKQYTIDDSWTSAAIGSVLHGTPPAVGIFSEPSPNQKFINVFKSIPALSQDQVHKLPSETFDRVVSTATGPEEFLSSDQCMNCHAGLNGPFGPTMFLQTGPPVNHVQPGYDVSPYGEWRWSPMGLAGRDPIFYSQMDGELAVNKDPANQTLIPSLCIGCHGYMGEAQLIIDMKDKDFKLDYINLTDRSDSHFKYGALARDGVSCAACHHIVPDKPQAGTTPLEDFLKNKITGAFSTGPAAEMYGQFTSETILPFAMENALGITPQGGPYIKQARLCGSCHTIRLPVLDAPGKFSIEQATYLEWLNSQYQNEFAPISSGAKTCQNCHMPGSIHNKDFSIDQLKEKIAIIEDLSYPEVFGRELFRIDIKPKDQGFARHTLLGLNGFLLEMFKQFSEILGVRTSDYMSGSDSNLSNTFTNYVQQAQSDTARIEVAAAASGQDIDAKVTVTNLTGHRFPTGVGFRRAFIEFLVTENDGGKEKVVWSSGRTNDLGIIVDGKNGQALASEFFSPIRDKDGTVHQAYQRHYESIDSQDQAQIYEELTRDAEGKFTTVFTQRDEIVKDNRLLPAGWTRTGPDPSLNGEFLEATFPQGSAWMDPEYQDGSGTDQITYKVKLPGGVDPSKCTVRATLYYQAIPPAYLDMRFKAAPSEPATQRLSYLASHVNLAGTELENWKLRLVSAAAAVR